MHCPPFVHPVIRREVERLQRIVEGQNHEIRKTLSRYSDLVERQRATLFAWRTAVLTDEVELTIFATRVPARYAELLGCFGAEKLREVERAITLHHIDTIWADHIAFIAEVREGIHLVSIGGMDPFQEFVKRVAPAFSRLHQEIENRTAKTLAELEMTAEGLVDPAFSGPSSTWTYLINDQAVSELHRMLLGSGNTGFSAIGVMMTWPLLMAWAFWRRVSKRAAPDSGG